jgi:hypothetical protein
MKEVENEDQDLSWRVETVGFPELAIARSI